MIFGGTSRFARTDRGESAIKTSNLIILFDATTVDYISSVQKNNKTWHVASTVYIFILMPKSNSLAFLYRSASYRPIVKLKVYFYQFAENPLMFQTFMAS